jgi:hypothetical protein
VTSLFQRSVVHSLSALIEEIPQVRRLTPRRKRGPCLGSAACPTRDFRPIDFAAAVSLAVDGWKIGLDRASF